MDKINKKNVWKLKLFLKNILKNVYAKKKISTQKTTTTKKKKKKKFGHIHYIAPKTDGQCCWINLRCCCVTSMECFKHLVFKNWILHFSQRDIVSLTDVNFFCGLLEKQKQNSSDHFHWILDSLVISRNGTEMFCSLLITSNLSPVINGLNCLLNTKAENCI